MRPGDALLAFSEAATDDLGRLLAAASTGLNGELFHRLTAMGHTVRPATMPVFAGLDPEGTHISALASRAGISRQAMSALVRDVEAAGQVVTSADPADKRAILVELTESGAQMCRDAADLSRTITAEWRGRLGDGAFEAVLEAVRTIGTHTS
jgi:DNA-binding MarR family transcriptional regulator